MIQKTSKLNETWDEIREDWIWNYEEVLYCRECKTHPAIQTEYAALLVGCECFKSLIDKFAVETTLLPTRIVRGIAQLHALMEKVENRAKRNFLQASEETEAQTKQKEVAVIDKAGQKSENDAVLKCVIRAEAHVKEMRINSAMEWDKISEDLNIEASALACEIAQLKNECAVLKEERKKHQREYNTRLVATQCVQSILWEGDGDFEQNFHAACASAHSIGDTDVVEFLDNQKKREATDVP